MKKIITTIMSLASMVAMVAFAPVASANYSINTDSGDCKTVTIGNYTTGEGINGACWTNSSVSATPGQAINVAIYYHNAGNTPANNVVFKMTDPQGTTISSGGSISITGKILVDGTEVESETVTLNVTGGSGKLVLGNVMRYDRPSHTNVPINNGNRVLTSSGLSYGTLQPGWDNQGVIKASFSLVGSQSNDSELSIDTTNVSHLNEEEGEARLNGSYHSDSSVRVWFKYRRNGGEWRETSEQSRSAGEGDFSASLDDLASGDYEFKAMGENNDGDTDEGGIVDFTIDRNDGGGCTGCCNDCGGDEDIEVETRPATGIDEDSAKLVGDLNEVGTGNVERWFEYDTDEDEVEDGDGSRVSISGDTDNDGEFSKTVTGLRENRQYFFRACAEDDDGNRDCGNVRQFRTDRANDNNDDDDGDDTERPDITTLNPVSIGSSVATVDGYYNANGCSVTTFFQYGRTSSLGSSTATVNRGNGSGGMLYSFTSLAANTTYYYRAVGTNCEGTTYGATKSFTTGSVTVINPPVVISTGGGGGNSFIRLMIDNHRETVRGGSEIAYDVSWENITRSTLRDLVLEVNFPDQMIVLDTDRGEITRGGHSVVYQIEDLTSREAGEMTIITEVRSGLREGDPVVAQAIMAFENPTTEAAENAIAYDADEFSLRASVLGASLFGLGFLPGSLAGWLILILIILAIIILVRYFMGYGHNRVTVNTAPVAVPPAPAAPVVSGDDYIVYRPNPKQ